MTDIDDVAILRERVAQLEAENRALTASTPGRRAGGVRWRTPASAVCLVLAALLIPVAIIAGWVRAELVDPERFVATLGPVVDAPEVQALVIDEASAAIQEALDVGEMTDAVIDGVASLDLPPAAISALELLRGPAEAGVRGLIDDTIATVVASDAFAQVWEGALRVSHGALVAAASGSTPGGGVTVDSSGVVALELEPIIEQIRERLLERGVAVAAVIPTIDRTVVLVQSDALVTVQSVYTLALVAGTWLPIVAGVLLIAGVVVARRRLTALLGAGVAAALGAGALLLVFGAGSAVLPLVAADAGLPAPALAVMYDQVGAAMRQTAAVLIVLGIAVALLAWTQGRSRAAGAIRGSVGAVNDAVRRLLADRGMSPAVGAWFERYRMPVRAALAVGAVLWLVVLRPLGGGDIAMVCAVALLLWWIAELLRRPRMGEATDAAAGGSAERVDDAAQRVG